MSDSEAKTIIITSEEAGQRLDRILAVRYAEMRSRSYFQHLIRDNSVLLNGEIVKKHQRPKEGDEVEICFACTPEIELIPEDIPLDIIYEDEAIVVVNKSAGMVIHPAPGNWSQTFVNALLFHCRPERQNELDLRPGIVHRLDKETSGVLVAAKTRVAQARLIELFCKRKIYKEYLAVCLGNPGNGQFVQAIGRHPVDRKKMMVTESKGRYAKTRYQTLESNGTLSLLKIALETGRTHQIRVHLSHHKTPVLGDAVYGNSKVNQKYHADRQLLHAKVLKFKHPLTEELMSFEAKIPSDMAKFVQRLQKQ